MRACMVVERVGESVSLSASGRMGDRLGGLVILPVSAYVTKRANGWGESMGLWVIV